MTLVEQEPVLPPASTLRESLALRGALDDDPRRARALARRGAAGRVPASLRARRGRGRRRRPRAASASARALALAFALQPDLLLLDEPTNHLDLDGIELLEELLQKAAGAAIVITHDRAFLDRVATRIVELDRGLLRSYPGNFAAYEARKADELAAEAVANRKFDRFWAQEEAWIRKGVEARRTRNEGRVRRLESLRGERAARRERLGQVKLGARRGRALGPARRGARGRLEALRRSRRSCATCRCA